MKMSSVELDRNVLCKKCWNRDPIRRFKRTFDDESKATGIHNEREYMKMPARVDRKEMNLSDASTLLGLS